MIDQKPFDLKIFSSAKELRLCVIENAINIEELASRLLGKILNIEWQTSKSFGHSSSSLSFNQKLQLIRDIKGIEKEGLKKLTCIAEIRNKFAHTSHIDSFETLFSDPSGGQKIKKEISNWYFDKNGDTDIPKSKHEVCYRLCFYLLVHDVIEILLEIGDQHSYDIGFKEGVNESKDILLSKLTEELVNLDQIESIRRVFNIVKNSTNNAQE